MARQRYKGFRPDPNDWDHTTTTCRLLEASQAACTGARKPPALRRR